MRIPRVSSTATTGMTIRGSSAVTITDARAAASTTSRNEDASRLGAIAAVRIGSVIAQGTREPGRESHSRQAAGPK
jgi:hypothetical protein